MPTLITKRGKKRYKGVAIHKVMGRRERLFPDGSKESLLAATTWEIDEKNRREEDLKGQPIHTEYLALYDWSTSYLHHSESNYAVKTYKEKVYAFSLFAQHVKNPNLDMEDIDPPLAYDFLSMLNEKKSGYATNKVRKNMSAAWTWGSKFLSGFPNLQQNPFETVDKFPEVKTPRYVPQEDDFWKVYDSCLETPDNEIIAKQDQTILLTFLNCAARRGEIWRLKLSDLDFHNKRIRLYTRKRKHGDLEIDILPMTEELETAMKEWIDIRMSLKDVKDNNHVFIDLSKFSTITYGLPFSERRHFMKSICKRAKVKHFSFHAIRHLSASILYKNGNPIAVIQGMLRHQNKSTTEIYLRSLGLEELRDGLAGAFQRPKKAELILIDSEEIETEEEPADLVDLIKTA